MRKLNCWEYMQCGREPGGAKATELGVCPAAMEQRLNGVHDGFNGGRACWILCRTICGGRIQGSYAAKLAHCTTCEFIKRVQVEEGSNFARTAWLLSRFAE